MSNHEKMNTKSIAKKMFCLFFAAFLSCSVAFAETGDDYDDGSEDIKKTNPNNMNEVGDQFIKIGLMVTKPLNFDGTLLIGGAGELGYHRFLTQNFLWGIDIAFGYDPTIGSNIFTYVPLVFSLTYQPTIKRFEIPITAGIGLAMENYLNKTYFPGLAAKGDIGVYFRATPSWSFGIDGQFMYLPEWYSDSSKNDYGLFASVELAARYHF
ncbi:MAG: hypothetical protein IKO57_12235 [Treponema sp.]|nr:hypothetical protein [Treponema sp.]